MGKPGYVYLLRLEQDKDPLKCVYKIGRTNDVKNRQKMLGVLLPYRATVVWAMDCEDAAASERFFHEQLHDKRLKGEWFQLEEWQIGAFVLSGLMGMIGEHVKDDPDTHNIVDMFVRGEMNYEMFCIIQGYALDDRVEELVEAVQRAAQSS